MIKLRNLKWEDYTEFSGEYNVIKRVLIRGRKEGQSLQPVGLQAGSAPSAFLELKPINPHCRFCTCQPLQSHESITYNEFLPTYVHILLVLFLWRTLTDIYFIFIFGLDIYNQNNCFLTIASFYACYKKRWKCLKNPCRIKTLSLRNLFHPVFDQMKLFT